MDKDDIGQILARGCTITIESKLTEDDFTSLYHVRIGSNADPFQKLHVRKILNSMSELMGDDEKFYQDDEGDDDDGDGDGDGDGDDEDED